MKFIVDVDVVGLEAINKKTLSVADIQNDLEEALSQIGWECYATVEPSETPDIDRDMEG